MHPRDIAILICLTCILALAVGAYKLLEYIQQSDAEMRDMIHSRTQDRIFRSEIEEWRADLDAEAKSYIPSAEVPPLPVHSPPYVQ